MRFLDSQSARHVALTGAVYLSNATDGEGRFVYWRRSRPLPPDQADYNALRHFGAIWSMLDVATQCGHDDRVVQAAGRALDYGLGNFVRPFGSPDVLCIVDGAKTKLGGAALAVVAISASGRKSDPHLKIAASLGNYILSQLRPDGTFIHSRAYPLGFQLPFVSSYYTGQALLALFALSDMTGDEKWARASLDILQRLATMPTVRMESSHWMLYAIEHAARRGASQDVRRLAGRIACTLLHSSAAPKAKSNTTSLACTVEGLSAWLRMNALFPEAASGVDAGTAERQVRMHLAAMLKTRNKDGSFSDVSGEYDVRIDYVQHAISAFMAYASHAGAAA